ncbi:hypothetical protein QE152_g26279 [Popillia japonica]|uniref:Uncharacterized protein n=1 Tax=Popillia japonica TaxID=7064 RepID=A0AAW1JZ45_POPJA
MLRTPPKTQRQSGFASLPSSPADERNDPSPSTPKSTVVEDEEETPTPNHSGSPAGVDELSDDQIMAQIRSLQKLLEQRRNNRTANRNLLKDLNSDDHQSLAGVSPVDMDTSFCSTASLLRAVCPGSSRKRKGSSSPLLSPRTLKVTAQIIHSPRSGRDGPSEQRLGAPSGPRKASTDASRRKDLDRIDFSSPRRRVHLEGETQAVEFPPLSNRTQRQRTPPKAPAEIHTEQPPASRENKIPPIVLRDKSEWCGISAEMNKIPPIVLRDKSGWCGISAEIRRKGFSFIKAGSQGGVPMPLILVPGRCANATYTGPTIQGPEAYLLKAGSQGGVPMPLILVQLSKDQKHIYKLKELVSLDVSVKTLRANPLIG